MPFGRAGAVKVADGCVQQNLGLILQQAGQRRPEPAVVAQVRVAPACCHHRLERVGPALGLKPDQLGSGLGIGLQLLHQRGIFLIRKFNGCLGFNRDAIRLVLGPGAVPPTVQHWPRGLNAIYGKHQVAQFQPFGCKLFLHIGLGLI